MDETILSAGIDLGTTTTQLVLSRLTLHNQAPGYCVPDIAILGKEVIYKSRIHFTPLKSDSVIDADGVRQIISAEYAAAGIAPGDVQTGAVIITGETARKENAAAVLQALSSFAGDFVVATAGPDLESLLAARGAGADEYAKASGLPVLHFDIGGGTSNLALFCDDAPPQTGCLNVGGRLIKLDAGGEITYLSPVLDGQCNLHVGQRVTPQTLQPVIDRLVGVLEQAAGLRPKTEEFSHFVTNHVPQLPQLPPVFSFSGGVADLIAPDHAPDWLAYGDIGVLLGRGIADSLLVRHPHRLGQETIRATVIGAGSHTTELSGSTIAYQNVTLPLKNLPVLALPAEQADLPGAIQAGKRRLLGQDTDAPMALFLSCQETPGFAQICAMADGILHGMQEQAAKGVPVVVVTAADMAKALGGAMKAQKPDLSMVCIDRLSPKDGTYLDVGTPVAGRQVLPVVLKTLVLN